MFKDIGELWKQREADELDSSSKVIWRLPAIFFAEPICQFGIFKIELIICCLQETHFK